MKLQPKDFDNPPGYASASSPVDCNSQTGTPSCKDAPQPVRYDPQTGAPIYKDAPQPVRYDPQTGAPIYKDTPQPVRYDPQTGAPIYKDAPQPVRHNPQPVTPRTDCQSQTHAATAPNSTPNKRRKKVRTGLIIGSAASIVAMIAIILGFVFLRGTPMQKVSNALDNTLEALFSRNDGTELLSGIYSDHNITIDLTADDIASIANTVDDSFSSSLNASASGTISANKNNEASMDVDLNVQGFSANMQLYLSSDEVIFSSPALLGNNYGISLDNLDSRLDSSIFAPDSGSDYALSTYDYDQFISIAHSLAASGKESISPEEFRKSLISAIEKDKKANPEFDVSRRKVKLDGEKVKCSVYSTVITGKTMAAILRVTANVCEDTMPWLSASNNVLSNDPLSNIRYIANEIESDPSKVNLEFSVYKGNLVRIDASVAGSDQSFCLDFGKDPAASDRITLTVGTSVLTYARTKDSGSSYEAVITASSTATNYVETLFSVSLDKKSGNFNIDVNDGRSSLSGTLRADSKSLYLEPTSIYSYGDWFNISGLSAEVSNKDSVKKPSGGYIDLLDMTEADMDALVQRLSSTLPF